MSQREPFEYIEIDVDFCALTYGTAPCSAGLGSTGEKKCFNMFRHCQDQGNFDKATKTLRFCANISGIPVDELFFPCLLSVSSRSSSVNIAGANKKLSAFGKRATLDVVLQDFPYHDRLLDKYQRERISGAALASGNGYDPAKVGTFFPRLLARWPYYANRPVRHVEGYIDDGEFVAIKTSHFIIVDFEVDSNDRVTLKGRDPLDLASNEKSVLPQPSNGVLALNIGSGLSSFDLSPEGIGDSEYPETGRALVGSEYMAFTRTEDTITPTERGLSGTIASSHDQGENFQVGFSLNDTRVDDALADIFINYAGIDPSYIPTAKWEAEITRWAPGLKLTGDVVKPEDISKFIPEISTLGFSIWWDDENQEVGLKAVRPIDNDTIFKLNDDNAIKEISISHNQSDRITEVLFSTVIKSPLDDPDSSKSYLRGRYIVDPIAKSDNAYGDSKFKEINCRLLNQGNDDLVRVTGRSLLRRFVDAPKSYEILLDAKDNAIGLTDVLEVTSRNITDDDGAPLPTLMQVVEIKGKRASHDFTVVAQDFTLSGRFGYCMENDAPVYDAASAPERDSGNFAVDENTLKFPDNTLPYEAI